MQDYTNSKRDSIKTFLLFLVIVVIAYLPVSSFLFFLKNDAFNGYFPPKFFMSESIHSGYMPWWNPYINFGLPQYGDMSSGFWSPVTWLIAATVGYTAYSFTMELLFYVFIAGIGMYLLCKLYELRKDVSIIAGLSFMCCGYMIGHLQHFNWISGSAFLPVCTWAYLRLVQRPSVKTLLIASLLFYLFAASAHPGIIIAAIYFFAAYSLFIFFNNKQNTSVKKRIYNFGKTHIALLLLLTLFSAGMIVAYADIIPHITRGEKLIAGTTLENPYTLQSLISLLLPLSTVKADGFFLTDISMRNMYVGIVLLLFLIYAVLSKKNSIQKFYLVTALAFFLISTGYVFKNIANPYLPLMGFVRMSGEFIIFPLMCFIIVAAFTLNNFFEDSLPFTGTLKLLYYLLEIVCFLAIAIGIYQVKHTQQGLIYHIADINLLEGPSEKIKHLIDSATFNDMLWIQGIVQLLLLWCIKWCLVNHQSSRLLKVVIADLVLASLLNIPFTGVGKSALSEVQIVLNQSPAGIPVSPLKPIVFNDTIPAYETGLVGNWSFYNKQIGVKEFAFYPVELNTTKFVFQNAQSDYFQKPYVFFAGDSVPGSILVENFSGNDIYLKTISTNPSTLVFQQNFYPHWSVEINGKKYPVEKYRDIFLATTIPAGSNEIRFVFDPVKVKAAMMISMSAFVLAVIILLLIYLRLFYPSWRRR